MERFKMGMVHDFRDKTVAKVRAEVLKEKENDTMIVKDDMSSEIERIYSAAQQEKGVGSGRSRGSSIKSKRKGTRKCLMCIKMSSCCRQY